MNEILVLVIFSCTLIGLVKFQDSPEKVFGVASLACLGFNFVSTQELLVNAVNPGLITLILLVICAFVLERTSYIRRLAQLLIGPTVIATNLKTLLSTFFASAFLNNTAVVATLINPIKSNKLIPANQLLLPVSYAAILGGTLTLIGTSTNLIVNSMLIEKGYKGFQFFDFFVVGLSISLVCLVVVMIRMVRLKGKISEDTDSPIYFLEATVEAESPLIEKTVEANGLRNIDQLFLVEIVRSGRLISPVSPAEVILPNDRLIFSGDVTKVSVLQQFEGLSLYAEVNGELRDNLREVVIKPGSAVIGRSIKSSGFRSRFDAAVVAIRRDGGRLSGKLGEIRIKSGDFLVLAVGADFNKRQNITKNFFLLNDMQLENALSGWREKLALWGFISAVLISIFSPISLLTSFIFYLAVLVATNCLDLNEIKRRFPLELWIIVVSALTLATSLDNVGLSEHLAQIIETSLSGLHVWWAFAFVLLVTMVLTELITNNAAAALMFPLAYSIAVGFGVDIVPFIMAVAFGASGSFVSPYGYQTNLMVYNAGSYSLKEFVRFGWPISLVYLAMASIMIPIVFPF